MITKQRQLFYFVGDKPFKDLVEAQKHDLKILAQDPKSQLAAEADWTEDCIDTLVTWLMQNATQVVDILTTTPRSRVKARKSHGGTKKRQPKLVPAVKVPATIPAGKGPHTAETPTVVVTQSRAVLPGAPEAA